MNFFADVRECWNEDKKLFLVTTLGGLMLAGAVPFIIALVFAL